MFELSSTIYIKSGKLLLSDVIIQICTKGQSLTFFYGIKFDPIFGQLLTRPILITSPY